MQEKRFNKSRLFAKQVILASIFLIVGSSFAYATTSLTLTHSTQQTMTAAFYIDHVTIVVSDLNKAMSDFSQLGFSVISTGKFSDNATQNAHIPFKDGSYIELFAPVDSSMMSGLTALKQEGKLTAFMANNNIFQQRFMSHLADGEGLADFALSSHQLNWDTILTHLNTNNVIFIGPIAMSRIRPNHVKVMWTVATPISNALPFLIKWQNKEILPKNITAQSKLKIEGISNITIVVKNLARSVEQYQILLGIKPKTHLQNPLQNAQTVDFQLQHATITLASPISKNGPLYEHLQQYGEGPYLIHLNANIKKSQMLDMRLSHNAKIELVSIKHGGN